MFRLYKEERHTLPFHDYAMLMREAWERESALEFGPGISTLALIEAGVKRIVTCEYNDEWFEKAKEQFKDYPQVTVLRFWDEPEARSEAEGEFDMALVDSPKGYKNIPGVTPPGGRVRHSGQEDCSRFNTCVLALKHAPVVYLHDANRPLERGTLGRLNAMGHPHTMLGGRAGLARIIRNGRKNPD